MTESPQQPETENPHDDDLDVEGPNESVPNTPHANPQEQEQADSAS